MTDTLPKGVSTFKGELALAKIEPKVRIGTSRGFGANYGLDSATGFLFMNALYEANGIESVAATIRSLRTKTFNDQDLIRILVASGSPEQQTVVKQVVCNHVLGATRNYCVPGS